MYCALAIGISLLGGLYSARHIRASGRSNGSRQFQIDTADATPVLICIVACYALWRWGNQMAMPAYDEVFSAQNVAGIHPFQAVAYYMLPNNHLLFNLLNNVFFSAFTDKVATGRVISLAAYTGFVVSGFFWLKHILHSRWLGLLGVLALSVQFPAWGFSFQARGYELYLLAEWGLIISLFSYLATAGKHWLYLNALCAITGYFCLPSFLYIHLAQCLFLACYMLLFKKKEVLFWKYQIAALLITFLCYLPALCFSGLDAIAHNSWVAPMSSYKTALAFSGWMFPYFGGYLTHIFSDVHLGGFSFNLILLLLPATLLLDKKNKLSVLYGGFYTAMWAVFFMIAIAMKRLPFERNLIGHYSITLMGVIFVIYRFTQWLPVKINGIRYFLFSVATILIGCHFISSNGFYLKNTLYEYEVNADYRAINNGISDIPTESSVAVSDEGFYAGYLCKMRGCRLSKCPTGTEDYFVKQHSEPLPAIIAMHYALVKTNGDYEIYKRK